MGIGKKIESRRKELGLTLEQVGDAVGVGKSTVRKWETGYIANMRRDKIAALAKVLHMDPTEFINAEPTLQTASVPESNLTPLPQDKVFLIPLFGNVAAGFSAYADNEVLEYIPVYLKNSTYADSTIAIKVVGNSMYPKIEDGDTIVVRRQESVDSGTIAVVLLDGEEGLVKKVEYGPDWINLISINPEYAPRRFEGEEVLRLRVVGKVMQIIKDV